MAGINSDTVLIELGARFAAFLAEWQTAYRDWKKRKSEFDALVAARAPKALRWDFRTDFRMPFSLGTSWRDGDLIADQDVAFIRSRAWGDVPQYTSGVTGSQAQRRADAIASAFDRWQSKRDARAAALRLCDYDEGGQVMALENRVRDLQDEIAAAPAAETPEGNAVKALSTLWQIYFGIDQEAQLIEIAEQVLRAAGMEPPAPVF
jgi:hypothetical protein